FSLRQASTFTAPSPAGTALNTIDFQVSSLRDFGRVCISAVRKLKPTVNKVLSLRDFFAYTLMCRSSVIDLMV
ncbi:MAG: hypothetical protein LBC98_09390, partial [Prevotellaceae bacterium]|nr:hypothetical protein [Prevotellaceae bacterium]